MSFFSRLLLTFVLCSIIPLFLLAFVFTGASMRIIRKNAARQARETVTRAAQSTDKCVGSAFEAGHLIAGDRSAQLWCAENSLPDDNARYTSDVLQQIVRLNEDDEFQLFVVSCSGTRRVLARQTVPDEYRFAAYDDWGVFKAAEHCGSDGVLCAQPHPADGSSAIAAVVVPVFSPDDSAKKIGYVIVDILRSGFDRRIAAIPGARGRFNQLYVYDRSGCIAYSGFSSGSEGSFFSDRMTQAREALFTAAAGSSGLTVCGIIPEAVNSEYLRSLRIVALVIALVTSVVSFGIALLFSRSIARPVQMLSKTMELAESGDFSVRCPVPEGISADTDMLFLVGRFNRMVERIAKLTDDRMEQQRLLRIAEVKRLQAQISPHFLYNTLNSIKSMAKLAGVNDIARMVTNLGKILRDGFTSGEDFCSVEKSLELVHNYFDIEAMRWEHKFSFIEAVDDRIMAYPLPRFVIQPVVENALVHGLEEKNGPGTLTIRGTFERSGDESSDIIITVSDDGTGIPPEKLSTINEKLACASAAEKGSVVAEPDKTDDSEIGSNGIALVNTHLRLRLLYGPSYGLSISSTAGTGTTVTIRIPGNRK